MPAGSLVRIPTSTSRNGTCKTNLRGVRRNSGSLFDFIDSERALTYGPDLAIVSTTGSGNWSNTIQYAFQNTNSDGDASITYPSVISTKTSGTLLFRMYIQPYPTTPVPGLQAVFINGSFGTDGYGVFLTYDEVAFETYEYNTYFGRLQDLSADWIKLNPSALSESTWYQFSIKFETSPGNPTEVTAFQDGSKTVNSASMNEINDPTTTTALMYFYGRMTDIALLEDQLSPEQLVAYGTAPYV